ncbi:integrator complex subunit 6-like [Anneissia japonica]|uniref:integrator complex subunit 6-like n=1 Tax=Anneissia japonica TaxID=1529436 RepID=UPI001425507B|nr:integrator complex subunit 6-like [Anneissia japonica]
MPVLVFLVDTSASMNQRTHLGTTMLDIAKGAVETFMKVRMRDQTSRGDRYMLVTCDEPGTIKAGWKDNHATFMNELKNLEANSLSNIGLALRKTFDLLNVNRLYTGIDNYGLGRNPFYLEPAMIIAITDGSSLTSTTGVHDELQLPMSFSIPGGDLTKEPFRWDQRLFALVLRIPGVEKMEADRPSGSMVLVDNSPITSMCDVTGGRSYTVNSMKTLYQCLESLSQKMQSGVVLNFEKIGPDPQPIQETYKATAITGNANSTTTKSLQTLDGNHMNGVNQENKGDNKKLGDEDGGNEVASLNISALPGATRPGGPSPIPDSSWHSCHRMIYVRPNPKTGFPSGHWPVPESFWPDINSPMLPPRDSHPAVKFSCASCEPMVVDNMPFDKYELEPSPLTQNILERRNHNICWQVFIENSGKNSELGHPFGYLKASTNLAHVNLFIMPYNYPVLLPLLDDLIKVHKMKPTPKWRMSFDAYLREVPSYYLGPMRTALRRLGTPNLIPDNVENCLSYSVVNYMKKLKQQSKIEAERMASLIPKKRSHRDLSIKVLQRSQMPSLAVRKDFQQLLQSITGETVTSRPDNNISLFHNFSFAAPIHKTVKQQVYHNPFDIPRKDLVEQLQRMRKNLMRVAATGIKHTESDQLHDIPIAEMGNYQDYLKRMQTPLREADPPPARLHMFGNPFKLASEKDKKMMVDEADLNDTMTAPQQRNKRSIDTPPTSPAAKRMRPSTPSPPSRRPNSPAMLGSVQGGILKKPYLELVQRREKKPTVDQNSQGKPPPIADDKPPDVILIKPEPLPASSINNTIDTIQMLEDKEMMSLNHNELNSEQVVNNNTQRRPINNLEHQKRAICGEPKAIISRAAINEINKTLKQAIVKEIRKPGRDYSKIFENLNNIQGDLDTKYLFINNIIREAGRFKKRRLIEMLIKFQKSVVEHEENLNKQRNNNMNNHVKKNLAKR